MAVNYHVVLKDPAGSQVAIFTDWQSLSFVQVVDGLKAWSFQLNGDDDRIDLFEVDGQVEFYRGDVAMGIQKYKEFEGLVRVFDDRFLADDKRQYTTEGRGYCDLLARRVIGYYAGSSQTDKAGPSETVMKQFVNENCGPGAASVSRLANGVITGFAVAPDLGLGSTWTGARAYRNVLDICQEIAVESGMDFDVVGTGPATYEFRTYPGQRGEDRTVDGLDPYTGLNAAGNAPLVFALNFGNMRLPHYRDSRVSEVNSIFVLGQGAESNRSVEVVDDATAIAASPINRREISRDARNEDTTNGLTDRGNALLQAIYFVFKSANVIAN